MVSSDPQEMALLRAICASPECDLSRLICANWFEERNTPATRQYARFIRKQLDGELFQLSLIASTLFESLFGTQPHTWKKKATAGECVIESGGLKAIFRRGFISRIECSLLDFLGGTCKDCGGERPPLECPNPKCDGGIVTGLIDAPSLVQTVTEVGLTNRKPFQNGDYAYAWFNRDRDVKTRMSLGEESEIPASLFFKLTNSVQFYHVDTNSPNARYYTSSEAALAAISQAGVTLIREGAKS